MGKFRLSDLHLPYCTLLFPLILGVSTLFPQTAIAGPTATSTATPSATPAEEGPPPAEEGMTAPVAGAISTPTATPTVVGQPSAAAEQMPTATPIVPSPTPPSGNSGGSQSSESATVSCDASLDVCPNVNISQLTGVQLEVAIAIDPNTSQNMFVFSNHQAAGPGLFAAYSDDGGGSWHWVDDSDGIIADGDEGDPLPPANADPSAAWDEFGNLFITYVIEDPGPDQEIAVALSTDGGRNFVLLETLGQFADQPNIVTGPGIGSTRSVWVSYKDFFGPNDPLVARGAAVNGLGDVDPFDSAIQIQSTQLCWRDDIAIGPDGQVVVVCQEGDDATQGTTNIRVSLNENGLSGPFDPPTLITTTEVGMDDEIPAQPIRHIDAAVGVVYDRTSGFPASNPGRLYLVYTDEVLDDLGNETDNTNIFVRFSDDDGATWSEPVCVNDDTPDCSIDDQTNSQFWPRIALDQTSGHVAVSWHDARNDDGMSGPGNRKSGPNNDTQFFASMSVTGGDSFLGNVLVSEGTSDEQLSPGDFDLDYGDYTGLAFESGYFYPAWADNSNSTCDNPDHVDPEDPCSLGTLMDIYTARVVPEPASLLALSSGIIAVWGLSFLRVPNRDSGARPIRDELCS